MYRENVKTCVSIKIIHDQSVRQCESWSQLTQKETHLHRISAASQPQLQAPAAGAPEEVQAFEPQMQTEVETEVPFGEKLVG